MEKVVFLKKILYNNKRMKQTNETIKICVLVYNGNNIVNVNANYDNYYDKIVGVGENLKMNKRVGNAYLAL